MALVSVNDAPEFIGHCHAILRRHDPILFVFGRADLTVPFYGAKIYPTDIEDVINAHHLLAKHINSFQLASYEDSQVNRRLKIHLDVGKNFAGKFSDDLRAQYFTGLCEVNQDFLEVTRMFQPDCIEIEVHSGSGPFADRDIRVKNKYIS